MAHSVEIVSNLTDDTAMELIGGGVGGADVYLAAENDGLFIPPVYDESYAASPSTEGAYRSRSRPENPVGVGKVYFQGDTDDDFWAAIASWEQMIERCRRFGGLLTYVPDDGPEITYQIESARLLSIPQRGPMLGQRHAESDFELVYLPYGLLPAVEVGAVVTDDFSTDSVTAGLWDFAEASPGQDEAVTVTGGKLTITTTLEKHMHRTDISMADGIVTAKFHTGTNDIGHGRVSMKYATAAEDPTWGPRWFAFDFNIQTNLCRLRYKADSPVGAVDGPTSGFGPGALATSTDYWAQIEFTGNVIDGRLYNADPFGDPAPSPIATRQLTLTGDDADALGERIYGAPGLAFFSQTDTNWTADDFRAEGGSVQSTEPLLELEVPPLDGSVDALGYLQITDAASQDRNHVEWGLESRYFNPDNPWDLFYDSSVMDETETVNGSAYGGLVVRTVLSTTEAWMVQFFPDPPPVGRFVVKARFSTSATPSSVRFGYWVRHGANNLNAWHDLRVSELQEVDLGVMTISPPPLESQHSVGMGVLAKSSSGTPNLDLDYIKLIPAELYGKAAGEVSFWSTAIRSGYHFRVRHEAAETETNLGVWTRHPAYVGSYLRVPVQGGRISVAANRANIDEEAHTPLGDSLRAELIVIPRVALLGA